MQIVWRETGKSNAILGSNAPVSPKFKNGKTCPSAASQFYGMTACLWLALGDYAFAASISLVTTEQHAVNPLKGRYVNWLHYAIQV